MSSDGEKGLTVRPSDLPFYSEDKQEEYCMVEQQQGVVEQNVRVVREAVQQAVGQAVDRVSQVVEIGAAHSRGAYSILLDEDNLAGRVGVVVGAGTLGLVVGMLRGRLAKRVMYTGLGTGAGAAICYPDLARQTGEDVVREGGKLANFAYNTVTGDERPVLPSLPSLDTSLIASTIRRSVYFLAWAGREVYKVGAARVAVLMTDEKNVDTVESKEEEEEVVQVVKVVIEPEATENSQAIKKVEWENGREAGSDFLARMFMEGKIEIDTEKKTFVTIKKVEN